MVNPESKKREQIAGMFDKIAGRYDLLNHLLSLNVDRYWRRKAITRLGMIAPEHILDLASGTGDFAFSALKLNPGRITGMDISNEMLSIGRVKAARIKGGEKIDFVLAGAENIPFVDNHFSAVTCAFGVRNFSDLVQGLKEACRVLKPGGKMVVLEFLKPRNTILSKMYRFYFTVILPVLGGWISGDKGAYSYLPASVATFPDGREFLQVMEQAGFHQCCHETLTGGIASIYTGVKEIAPGYNKS